MAGSKHFYDTIRPVLFNGSISSKQFEGTEATLKACADGRVTDPRAVAYILATVYHECAKTMQPIEEYGKGAAYDYGKQLKMGGGKGKRVAYETPHQLYYGRGYVQLTWYENYEVQGKRLGIDLLNHPELALQPSVAGSIMISGMTRGDFTGRKLGQFFTPTLTDYVGARKIINGQDKAGLIAGYAHTFFAALAEPQ